MERFDVAIVGGGVSGSALAFVLARYTGVEKIALVEKYEKFASLSSGAKSNSQTIHRGDIETNYTAEKAAKVKVKADMLTRYCLDRGLQDKVVFKMQKMAIGVGDEEVAFIRRRTEEFRQIFPELEIFEKDELKEIEPGVVRIGDATDGAVNERSLSGWATKMKGQALSGDRSESIVGAGVRMAYCAADFEKLSEQLISDAQSETNKGFKSYLNTKVSQIRPDDGGFVIQSDKGEIFSRFVIVNGGAHSLFLANSMGYGLNYSVFPVAGSFYFAAGKRVLNGKVYTVQNPKLPFAAIHGDPDITNNFYTRFGPTALVMPKLERFRSGTIKDFFKSLNFDADAAAVYGKLLFDRDTGPYIFKNLIYDLPLGLGRHFYDIEVQKVVPSLSEWDLAYADGYGGVRPQIIDKKQRKLLLGEASIKTGTGLIFNMTPSPGATSCIGNALDDAKEIASYLNTEFFDEKAKEELGGAE